MLTCPRCQHTMTKPNYLGEEEVPCCTQCGSTLDDDPLECLTPVLSVDFHGFMGSLNARSLWEVYVLGGLFLVKGNLN